MPVPMRTVAAIATLAAGLLMLGLAAGVPAGAAARSRPTWAGYFFPLKVGWTCHESIGSGGITGEETETVAAVAKSADGRTVTINEGSSTTVNGTTVPTNAVLHYVLTKNGELIEIPSSGEFVGQPFHIEGDTTFPSISAILSGATSLSTVHGDAPLSQSELSQIGQILKPHSTALDLTMVIKQSGHSVDSLTTPMGTFHDVLAVSSTLKSIKVDNAVPAASKELASTLEQGIAKDFGNTAWYAPAVGPVKVDVAGIIGTMTSCGPS